MKKKNVIKRKPIINGVKGAISLFLAVLMTPFLTIALLLVEVGRYNSAVSLLDEAMGVSSISTLAEYDDYLLDRWGLLAIDQNVDLQSVYSNNLATNASILGDSITIDKTTANGMYDLANSKILRSQILEYSKLNAPTTLAMEVFDISDLVKKLEKMGGFSNIASLLTKGVDAIDSGITLAESADKLKESANKIDGLHDDYESKYVAFEFAMNTLISNLQSKRNLENQVAPLKEELEALKAELEELQKKEDEENEDTTEPTEETETESEEVKEKKKQIEEKEKEIAPYQSQIDTLARTISSNRTSAKSARDEYASILLQISTELGTFKSLMESCTEAVTSIQNDIAGAVTDVANIRANLVKLRGDLADQEALLKDCKAELKKMEDDGVSTSDPSYIAGLEYKIALEEKVNDLQTQTADLETQAAIYDATANGIGKMADEWSTAFEDYSDAVIGQRISGFNSLRQKVLEVNPSSTSANSSKINRANYKQVALGGYINAADIDEYLVEQENELKSGTLKALLDGLTAIYDEFMGLSIFFEDNLDACIDLDYYNENFGGLPGGAAAGGGFLDVIQSIADVCSSASGLTTSLAKLKLLSALKELKNLATSVINLLESIAQLVVDLLKSITELFTGYDKWYYSTYCAYNLTCRTDYSSSGGYVSLNTMTGYKVGKDSFPESDIDMDIPVFGELASLINTINTYMNDTGADLSFSGAELEYVLFGSSSEVANQLYVFCILYLIRLLVNIPAISSNIEVQSLAAAATLGYPVVMGLYYVLEPLVQTILLVNGNSQGFLPTTIYLTPTGLPKLIKELVSFCKLTSRQGEQIGQKMIDAFAKSQDDYDYQKTLAEYEMEEKSANGLFDLGYRDYCFIIMLLAVTKDQQMARLSNIIQMETLCYYTNQEAEFTFDLGKAYTYIDATADVRIKQIMPSLADSSLFSISRKNSRGY